MKQKFMRMQRFVRNRKKAQDKTYFFHGLGGQHEWVLFLHADAIFDPNVQASEMGRVRGGIGYVETAVLFFLKFQ